MQDRAQLVVIGAGIVGCSTAYHLAQLGWSDMVVLDQGPLFDTGGSTSHAPGLVFQTNYVKMMTDLARYTVQFYSQLDLHGQPCFYPVGSMEVAATPERWTDLKRRLGAAKAWGLEAELATPQEAKEKIPLLDDERIYGAYCVPSDGLAKPVRACAAMAKQINASAAFHGHTTITGIEVDDGRVRAVLTSAGRIAADRVLICAGIWGPRLGRMAGVPIPLTPVQHLYTRTAPLLELAGETREAVHPILRHQDSAMYFRQHADCYGIGSYRHQPLLVEPDDIPSHDQSASPAILKFTPEHFEDARTATATLLPPLAGAELTYKINGMFSFTPDGMPLLGESLEVRGLWVAEAVWITHAGGVGKAMAEWMATGTPAVDLREADLNRFAPHALSPAYIKTRGAQQYREVYDVVHPLQQMETPRSLRRSPLHQRLEELAAVCFESAGWERPQWFAVNAALAAKTEVPPRHGWEAFNWSPIQGAEHLAARRNACLCDLSAFTKIKINGPGALAYLQHLAANQIDRPVGSIVYTSLLNQRGGIHCDLTISRLDTNCFLVLTGSGSGQRDLAWLRRCAADDNTVHIDDVTSQYCAIGLWGPQARQVLQRVCDDDLSNAAFPYFSARHIHIGEVPALALRLSYIGELGWELYTASEYGLRLWDTLWQAGRNCDLLALGGGAFDSLRLEKGYRLWGADIHSEHNPIEAGLEWTVQYDKGDFIGRQALLHAREAGVDRKLCFMTLDDPAAIVLGKEPILDGQQVLGYVTSANRGYSVGHYIACGYLPLSHTVSGTHVEVEYFGQRQSATVVEAPLYDPQGNKLKA